jgi:sugar phosphate isomerase/epimerase
MSPAPRIGLSTSSVYPEGCAAAFELAARLGYDGVEIMVWTDPLTREAGALKERSPSCTASGSCRSTPRRCS